MVDEAKAFCPGCGDALVEEERPKTTAFQKLDHTVQFGQTMYNQMLEDMGLNISETPDPTEGRVQVIAPLKTDVTIPPIEINASPPAQHEKEYPDKGKSGTNLKWYILSGLAVIILLPIALASALVLCLDVWSRWFR
jgi:hypothetical protein